MGCGVELGFVDVEKGGNGGKCLVGLRSVDDEGVAGFGVGRVAGVSGDVEERDGGVAWSMIVVLLRNHGFCE